jgi:RES domain-containing protein
MNLAAGASLIRQPEKQVWYRAIRPQHGPTALATEHTTRVPGRFTPASNESPAFPLLYLAENQQVALFEVGGLLGSPLRGIVVPNPQRAWLILNVQVTLQQVADLTSIGEQSRLHASAQELTGDWELYHFRPSHSSVLPPPGPAPTQQLGAALHGVPNLEGFRTISAKVPTHMVLVVFPDKLQPGSSIVFSDPTTGTTHTIAARKKRGRRT